ncbi:MAG: energy transducer TonB [Sphingomonas sp.]
MIVLAVAGLLMAAQATGASPMNPASWFDYNDYPIDAIRRGEQGRVAFTVAVDATGHPTKCRITTSSGSSALDDGTCAIIISKGRFQPAHDEDGKPIAGNWSSATRWALAQPGSRFPVDLSDGKWQQVIPSIRVTIDKDGHAVKCERAPGAPTVGHDPCAGFPVGQVVSGPLVKGGKPVTGIATFSLTETIEPAPDGS